MMTSVAEGKPDYTSQDAEVLARNHYGLEGSCLPLPSERDQNFRLETRTSGQYVLKISNANESRDILELQDEVLNLLSKQNHEGSVPRVIKGLDGEAIQFAFRGGDEYPLRLFRYVRGIPLAEFRPHSTPILEKIGRFMGKVDEALVNYSHPAANRSLRWDIANVEEVVKAGIGYVPDERRQALLRSFLTHWMEGCKPALSNLRRQIIHNDGNDYNVLIQPSLTLSDIGVGLLDFGDLVHSYTLSEVAITAAYVMFGKPDPLNAALQVLRGYHQVFPVSEQESELFFSFMLARLCMTVSNAAYQQHLDPGNPYLAISEGDAWQTLERLNEVPLELARALSRDICGLRPRPKTECLTGWLKKNSRKFSRLTNEDLETKPVLLLDLSVGGKHLGESDIHRDPERMTRHIDDCISSTGSEYALGRYGEVRGIYYDPAFFKEGNDGPEWRSLHLGVDVFMEAGAPVYAALSGRVVDLKVEETTHGYGGVLLLAHEMGSRGEVFYTLYGHLAYDVLERHAIGDELGAGEIIGRIGSVQENGGWPPHLHFQIITDHLGWGCDFPGVARSDQSEVWLDFSPDPNLILRVPGDLSSPPPLSKREVINRRNHYLSKALSLSYQSPLMILRGEGSRLFDSYGRAYLDAVNNVPHVGHSHPDVVRAVSNQMRILNTNTRYLHDNILEYAQRLTEYLPADLQVFFFVNSGSEANDLALRLAETHTGSQEWIVVDHAYHGNLTSLIDISPYKFDGPGGKGPPANTHVVPMPDGFRGEYKYDDRNAGKKYARFVREVIEALSEKGKKPAAFIAEPLMGVGGQIEPPPRYLAGAYQYVREAGGLCIADEVQIGFGRMGTHFWGFETQDAVPDILTLGKPAGNGHPLGVVVTTEAVAESFVTGMEYFNTFGGNPVSCAAGLAVLDVMEKEKLQENAVQVGEFLKESLLAIKDEHSIIGDVRGRGFFLGIEMVLDRETLEPAGQHASYVIERMKGRGVLLSTDGPFHNVIKIKPPMVFSMEDARFMLKTLRDVLFESALQI